MTSRIDAHVRLDTHPTHFSAVTAALTGSQAHIAHLALEAAGWTVVADNTLVLVRIDHEEPYWAKDAATHLSADGITVEITPRLQQAMDEDWTWVEYPMPWCTRSEIREISNQAQKIHDDIRRGQLLIHAHADDGETTFAVGTYLHTGKSVYLRGEDHLRQVADTFDSPGQALRAFEKAHGADMRRGPAPLTATERAAAEARTTLDLTTAKPEPRPEPETIPVYLADSGDHDALLDHFLDTHEDWDRWRTWSGELTYATHESQTLRIEHDDSAPATETAWTIAAYETPVSDRMWHLTATAATPTLMLQDLLHDLADGHGWDTAVGQSLDEASVVAATQPATDAGWKHTVEGRWMHWTAPNGEAGVQFDTFAAQRPGGILPTWLLWAGPAIDHPTWEIAASTHTPTTLLANLAETLTRGTGTRQTTSLSQHTARRHASPPPALPTPAARRASGRPL